MANIAIAAAERLLEQSEVPLQLAAAYHAAQLDLHHVALVPGLRSLLAADLESALVEREQAGRGDSGGYGGAPGGSGGYGGSEDPYGGEARFLSLPPVGNVPAQQLAHDLLLLLIDANALGEEVQSLAREALKRAARLRNRGRA